MEETDFEHLIECLGAAMENAMFESINQSQRHPAEILGGPVLASVIKQYPDKLVKWKAQYAYDIVEEYLKLVHPEI